MEAEAFKKEFLPYHQKLYRIAFRIVQNVANAEDVVQETYIKLWEKRNELTEVNNTESYAIIVLRNLCLDHLRSAKNKHSEVYNANDSEGVSESLTTEIELRDEANYVKRLINQLPEQYRQIVMLKDWDGYSNEEIEEITGLSSTNVRVILSRARKMVREQFQKLYAYGN